MFKSLGCLFIYSSVLFASIFTDPTTSIKGCVSSQYLVTVYVYCVTNNFHAASAVVKVILGCCHATQ